MSNSETITLDISDDELANIIQAYVVGTMSPESLETFNDTLGKTDDIKKALFDAVVNDFVILALETTFKEDYKANPIDCYIIPPLHNLELMHRGDRYFCLAHFYLQYPEYRDFFLALPDTAFVTLDNSAAERSLVTEEALIGIVEELKPDEVIAPDILFDTDQTIKSLESFITTMKDKNLIDDTKIFGCPQGDTEGDWFKCYDYMANHDDVSVIGMSKIAIPRAMHSQVIDDVGIKESRQYAVEQLIKNDNIPKPLHFLGMGDPTEYQQYDHPMIRSTDSCNTILSAVNGVNFFDGDFRRVKTTAEFYEKELSESDLDLAESNIKFLKLTLLSKEGRLTDAHKH